MNTEILFGTPIFVNRFDDVQDLNNNIKQDLNSFIGKVSNVFDVPGNGIGSLYGRIKEKTDLIAKEYKWNSPPIKITGRFNSIKPGGSDTPHAHGAYLVGVYYLEVPEKSGDILLHDPRGYMPWPNLGFTPDDPLNRTFRCYHRIKPVEGMLILFPGFLAHSVETNLSNRDRISIVLNVYN